MNVAVAAHKQDRADERAYEDAARGRRAAERQAAKNAQALRNGTMSQAAFDDAQRSADERPGTFPKVRARRPDRRHFGRNVTTRTRRRGKNTLIDGTVDVDADVAVINSGQAFRDADTGNWIANGRTYGMHENGTVFPVSGPGFHDASRGGFKALGAYNEFGGDTAEARRWIAQHKLSPEAAAEGLQLFRTLGR